jgi:hypothetical protein
VLSPCKHPFPFGREALKTLCALHDGYTKLLLQVLDPGRQGRLRDVTNLSGACKVLFLGQRSQVIKLADEHGLSMIFEGRTQLLLTQMPMPANV